MLVHLIFIYWIETEKSGEKEIKRGRKERHSSAASVFVKLLPVGGD